ncbi:MAG: hypothetical protein WCG75_01315 [Armatimonadota bacterium]
MKKRELGVALAPTPASNGVTRGTSKNKVTLREASGKDATVWAGYFSMRRA